MTQIEKSHPGDTPPGSIPRQVQDADRLTALYDLALLDTPAEASFDRLTRLVTTVLDVPVALMSLVDRDRQFFKSAVGLPEPWATRRQTPLSHSFCQHTIALAKPLIIDDARLDPLVSDNLAITDLTVIAYAGIPLLTSDGQAIGSLCAIDTEPRAWTERDITILQDLAAAIMSEIELRLAKRDSERERAHLESLVMQAPAIIALYRGPNHIIEMVNPGVAALMGDRSYVGKPVSDVLPEVANRGLDSLLDHVYTSGEPYNANEYTAFVERDGAQAERIFNFALRPLRDSSGAIDGLFLHALDVTEYVVARRMAEKLMAEQTTILRQIADGVLIVDTAGRFMFVNEAARRLLGRDLAGATLDELGKMVVPLEDGKLPVATEDLALSRAVSNAETIVNSSRRIRRPDGTEIVAQGSATPLHAEDGTRLGAVLTFRDVTPQFEIAQQKDEFLSAAAHDLKSPLTTIKGLAQLVLRQARRSDTLDAAKIAGHMQSIEATSNRMANLMTELLDATRIELGRPLSLVQRPTDLVRLVQDAVSDHQHALAGHEITFHPSVTNVTGNWDAMRLQQVVINLVTNAIKYSPAGTTIDVRVDCEGGGTGQAAVLTVQDAGIGIPESDLPHIFDRFFRASNVDKEVSGSGIGLAGVRQIVDQHGGTVEVKSREGVGSTFVVRLPLEAPDPLTGA